MTGPLANEFAQVRLAIIEHGLHDAMVEAGSPAALSVLDDREET